MSIHQIRCTARIHDIYWQTAEKTIEEERPRVFTAASSSNGQGSNTNSNNINWLQNVPYDQYSANDVGDKFDSQFQGKQTSRRLNPRINRNHSIINNAESWAHALFIYVPCLTGDTAMGNRSAPRSQRWSSSVLVLFVVATYLHGGAVV